MAAQSLADISALKAVYAEGVHGWRVKVWSSTSGSGLVASWRGAALMGFGKL